VTSLARVVKKKEQIKEMKKGKGKTNKKIDLL